MVIYGDCCLESAGYLVRGLWEHMLRWSMMIWRNWVKLSHMSKFQNPVTGLYWPILKKHVRKNCLQMKQLFSCSEFKNSLSRSFRNGIFQFGFPVFSSATTPNTRLLSVEKSTETCPLAWKDLEGSGRIWKDLERFNTFPLQRPRVPQRSELFNFYFWDLEELYIQPSQAYNDQQCLFLRCTSMIIIYDNHLW